jgi:hypothetical protein
VTESDTNQTITITAQLNDNQALAFAQFIKRAGFYDYRNNAVTDSEAYLMIDAANKIRKSLAEQGYAPR